jgi:hypothetical protein
MFPSYHVQIDNFNRANPVNLFTKRLYVCRPPISSDMGRLSVPTLIISLTFEWIAIRGQGCRPIAAFARSVFSTQIFKDPAMIVQKGAPLAEVLLCLAAECGHGPQLAALQRGNIVGISKDGPTSTFQRCIVSKDHSLGFDGLAAIRRRDRQGLKMCNRVAQLEPEYEP